MKNFLENIFGSELKSYQKMDVRLPLYLKENRLFLDVEIYGQKFMLIILPEDIRFNSACLRKQYEIYIGKFQLPVAYGFNRITAFQRKSLIENQLPFVAENGQIFLPFIGTYFNKCESMALPNQKVLFTSASQMLFLLLLYGADDLWINKGEAAKMLGITPMSVTRASIQLKQLGIIEENRVGTGIRIHRILPKMEAYEMAASYLINPVHKIIYVQDAKYPELKIITGEYALSYRSDLGYPLYKEYAINKKAVCLNEWKTCNPDLLIDNNAIKIQIWRYSPQMFAHGDKADPISLICSFKDNRDERIHKCLDTIKMEIETWQIVT